MDQHLQRHQRIAPDHLRDAPGVDVILDLAQVLQRRGGGGQHGDVALLEPARPALDVVWRAGGGGGGQGAHGGISKSGDHVPPVRDDQLLGISDARAPT